LSDRIARTQLDHIAVLEHRLGPAVLAERRSNAATHERGAVGRPEVLERRRRGPGVDARVLRGDVGVVDDEVVRRCATDANDLPLCLERLTLARSCSDEKPEHRPGV
jgi:hypothetical protein